jgi:hypothetical protein
MDEQQGYNSCSTSELAGSAGPLTLLMKLHTCVWTQFTGCAHNREFIFTCQSALPNGYHQRLLLNTDRRVH